MHCFRVAATVVCHDALAVVVLIVCGVHHNASLPCPVLLQYLNQLFTAFDDLVDDHGLYKLDTM